MSKKYSDAKAYIMQAKKRLLNNEYGQFAKDKYGVFYINNKRVTKVQLENMSAKIEEILASEEFVYDSLNKLIMDEEEFYKLDDTGKMRYMLELSKVYASLKKNIS